MSGYVERIIDKELDLYLDTFGAVLLRGPKWCGKTTTAVKHSKSVVKLQDPEKGDDYIAAANDNPLLILKGEEPRLIDEWQMAPKVWDAVRFSVDEDNSPGRFILTGSRVPAEGSIMHSGAGRFGVLNMYPMSLYESGDSDGSVSLRSLFDGRVLKNVKSNLSVDGIANCVCKGGWPANIGLSAEKCSLRLKSYLNLIYESDDVSMKKYAKDPDVAKDIVRSYSRNVSTMASMKTIHRDVLKNDSNLSESKFYDYISALKNAFIIDDLPAWSPSVRSRANIRSTPKRELCDPSIAALYLNITPENYIDDYRTFGFLFESMCIRDLKVYSSPIGGRVSYYHDRYDLETDAVVTLDDGRFGLMEVKLGSSEIDDAAANLNKLEGLLAENGLRKPVFKMVLTGTELAYVRKDGVLVVPVGCLGP